ncbi:Uncharacterised protein [uncultured archaeon]|nr:Uncharacterised protein [uncultured archaeon]
MTPEERIKLLKTGFTQKQIEKLYVEKNNFKIVNTPVFFELVEINDRQDKKVSVNYIEAVGYAQSICSEMVNICDISN